MFEFDHATPVSVSLRLQRGTADVIAEQRDTVQVDIADADPDTFTVRLDGDTLAVHAPESALWQWRRTPKARVIVRVPEGSSLSVKSETADLRAAGRYNTVYAALQSADAEVQHADGDINLKTESGDLRVGQAGSSVRLGSQSGDLEAGDVTGDVTANTASGDIMIRAAAASVHAETASGDVEVGLTRRGRVRLKTASGDVSVGVAAGTGVWLDVSTASGSTVNNLSMTPSGPPAENQATLELVVRTASGDITIHRVHADAPAL
ncbi:DUF4097 family beta strand repeat-containing protein [Actinoplanes friuliensis]|uniref:DUF4097 domain-containing protein n=1 Tax=Actinoplanes friuliensis DSM 7358 TaxID=1246995 RepID=U5W2Y3_9ACTN|nr:DUF4097 family beta strand repeat-containing protein [Actinoplanes friuliensis]AGZ43553.1 hypothetical protein AFR_26455 [Actinoplanes friuliensis DSM 7358]